MSLLDCGGDLYLFGGLPLILRLEEEAGAQGSTRQVHAHPSPPSGRAARKEYIMAKYMERRYVQRSGRDNPHSLWEAIRARDLLALLQAFAEGHDLTKPLASPEGQVSPAPDTEWIFSLGTCAQGFPGLWAGVCWWEDKHPQVQLSSLLLVEDEALLRPALLSLPYLGR